MRSSGRLTGIVDLNKSQKYKTMVVSDVCLDLYSIYVVDHICVYILVLQYKK